MTKYWYKDKDCPVCGQGRLFVEVREDTRELLLECEECYSAWDCPDRVLPGKGVQANEIPSHFASHEEIESGGWSKYGFVEETD